MSGSGLQKNKDAKIILPGGAGLVGQNLLICLKKRGYTNITVIDKHPTNLNILKNIHPDVTIELADLSEGGDWRRHFAGADTVVMLQAQIGGYDYETFVRNNIDSTRLILEAIKTNHVPHLVHISSSVVASVADDFYANSKREQELLVLESGCACPILRPTLMFGWFDRKHLGWLSRFLQKTPVFPIPGKGRFMRQPLYVGDFVNIIVSCIEDGSYSGVYNISGHEKIDYIDMIYEIKEATQSKAIVLQIPYSLFFALLWAWGLVDRNPPFTTQQLAALSANDTFEIIDWPTMFGVSCTPFKSAIRETFNDPRYSQVILDF